MVRLIFSDMPKTDRIRELLRGVPFLKRIGSNFLNDLALNSEIRELGEGDVVMAPGFFNRRLTIIESGSVLVVEEDRPGHERVLASYVAGDSFGELDLIGGTDDGYTARTAEKSVLCSFPKARTSAEEVFAGNPALGAEIAERMLRAIGDRTRSANSLVSEKAPWIEGLKEQIMTDKLTGLQNRTYLREELPGKLEHSGSKATILMVKPDNFKLVNDTYGHDSGDSVLGVLAKTVRAAANEESCVRFKGDVFCIVLEDSEHPVASRRAGELLQSIRELDITPFTKGEEFTLTASVALSRAESTSQEIGDACDATLSRIMEIREEGGDRYEWIG